MSSRVERRSRGPLAYRNTHFKAEGSGVHHEAASGSPLLTGTTGCGEAPSNSHDNLLPSFFRLSSKVQCAVLIPVSLHLLHGCTFLWHSLFTHVEIKQRPARRHRLFYWSIVSVTFPACILMRKQYWHQNICKAGRYFRRGESEGETAYIARPARLPGPQQIRKLCEDRLALCLWCGVTFYPIGFLKNHDSLDCHETAGQSPWE